MQRLTAHRLVRAVASLVLLLAGCSKAPEQPLAGPSPSPTTTEDRARSAASTTLAPGSPQTIPSRSSPLQPNQRLAEERPPGTLERPHDAVEQTSPREPAASPRHGSAAGAPSPFASEPDEIGPAASYDDPGDDAHAGSYAGALSQPSLDLLHVAWNPVSYEDPGRRGYSTSITIAGAARQEAVYVSWGRFADRSGGQCQLYNILRLGAPAHANVFCGYVEDGTRRFLGRVSGRPVTSIPAAAGGTTIVGTFDDPVVPSELEAADRRLDGLSAFSATCSPRSGECTVYAQEWDWVSSFLSFRV